MKFSLKLALVSLFVVFVNNSCVRSKASVTINDPNAMRELSSEEIMGYHNSFDRFFDSLLLRNRFSGGILVAKNGVVVYEKYQGFADGAKLDTINATTPFHVASTSKTFTSTAVLQLVDQGKIGLDDSLQTYFPLFPYKGITVRHLLNHSSGLPNYAFLFPKYKWNTKRTATNADVLQLFYTHRPNLDFGTGTRFKYCNTNFVLLALIVEKASGQFFPHYIKEHIFDRAGMTTSYVLSEANAEEYLPSWTGGGKLYEFNYLDALYGDKNVWTTCQDLFKYDEALRKGILASDQLLEKAWKPNWVDKKYREPIEYYGLGWRLKIFNDSLKIPYHNGWWHGNNAVFQRLIADTAVIIVTGNRYYEPIYSAAKAANVFRPYYPNVADLSPEFMHTDVSETGGN